MRKELILLGLAVFLTAGISACSMDEKKNNNQTDTAQAGANNTNGATNHDTLHVDTTGKRDSAR